VQQYLIRRAAALELQQYVFTHKFAWTRKHMLAPTDGECSHALPLTWPTLISWASTPSPIKIQLSRAEPVVSQISQISQNTRRHISIIGTVQGRGHLCALAGGGPHAYAPCVHTRTRRKLHLQKLKFQKHGHTHTHAHALTGSCVVFCMTGSL